MRWLRLPSRSAWCAQVTVAPEVSRMTVLSSGRCQGSKVSMLVGGQLAAVRLDTSELDRLVGEDRGVEEGPEPCREEHHLGGDEQHHPVAQAELHDGGVVVSIDRLADDIAPPHDHDGGDEKGAGEGDPRPAGRVVHVDHRAEGQQQRGESAYERPRARVDEMIGMPGFG